MFTLLALAHAATLPVQGFATDAGGAPVQGPQTVNFRIYDGSTELWSDSVAVVFANGSFAAELGLGAAIDASWLSRPALKLSLALPGGAPSEPVAVGWTPRAHYASQAGVASAVSGVLPRSNLPTQVAYTDGDASFTGSLTATGFSGSGAGLTSLPAGQVNGVFPRSNLPSAVAYTDGSPTFSGTVTATTFSGSGASLTNIPTSAITGATLSLSGTPNQPTHAVTKSFLDAALGSYLPLAGGTLTGGLSGTSGTFSGAVRAGAIGVGLVPTRPLEVDATELTVGLTSPAGPVRMVLGNRDSAATPGIILSANGSVQIGKGTSFSTTNGGTFTPAVSFAGDSTTSFAAAVSAPSLTLSGRLSSQQTFFEAKICSTTINPGSRIIWESVITNTGGAYNAANGVFTAPVTGVYAFGFNLLSQNAPSGEFRFEFYKNGGLYNSSIQQKTPSTWLTTQGTIITRLTAGETMAIQYASGTGTVYTDCNYNRFWGYLLG